jgi:hypothetical protein
MADQAPLIHTTEYPVNPQSTAGSDLNTVLGAAPYASTVTAVTFIPLSAVTGAATDNRTIALVNAGTAGTGTVSVASLAFASGVTAAALVPKAVTLSGTGANLVLAAGDVLEWTSTHGGSGIADPGGCVRITTSRNG